jgi:general stress protein 26
MASQSSEMGRIAEIMREIDFCMFTTFSINEGMYARPMSNNRHVEFDGDAWFFSEADSRTVSEIKLEPQVLLSYVDSEGFRFIALSGVAEVVIDPNKKRELWVKDLKRWFPNGPDDANVVLLKVSANKIAYWTGEGDGQITLS